MMILSVRVRRARWEMIALVTSDVQIVVILRPRYESLSPSSTKNASGVIRCEATYSHFCNIVLQTKKVE